MPLAPPPRDPEGNVLPHDAPDLVSGDGVIRRISDKQIVVDAAGQRRISSLAFKPSSSGRYPGMSVDLERSIIDAGLEPRAFVTTPVWTGSVRFDVSDLREDGLQVGSNPLPPENPHHGEVWGIASRGQQRRMQARAAWYVEIPGVLVSPS